MLCSRCAAKRVTLCACGERRSAHKLRARDSYNWHRVKHIHAGTRERGDCHRSRRLTLSLWRQRVPQIFELAFHSDQSVHMGHARSSSAETPPDSLIQSAAFKYARGRGWVRTICLSTIKTSEAQWDDLAWSTPWVSSISLVYIPSMTGKYSA